MEIRMEKVEFLILQILLSANASMEQVYEA